MSGPGKRSVPALETAVLVAFLCGLSVLRWGGLLLVLWWVPALLLRWVSLLLLRWVSLLGITLLLLGVSLLCTIQMPDISSSPEGGEGKGVVLLDYFSSGVARYVNIEGRDLKGGQKMYLSVSNQRRNI